MVEGQSNQEGLLQVYYNNTWGWVCANQWDKDDADVACRMMDFSGMVNTFHIKNKEPKPLHGSTICNVQEGNVLSSHVIVMVLGLMTVKQKLQLYANQKVTILKSNTNIKHVSKAPFLYGKRLKLSYRYLSTPQYT